MSYVKNETIQYIDVNKFATGSSSGTIPDPTLVNINSLWGVGYGNVGYGQSSSLPTISTNKIITSSDWLPLANILNSANKHQIGNTIVPVTLPEKDKIIAYEQQYVTNLTTLWNNRLNAFNNLTPTIVTKTVSTTSFTNTTTATFTVNFANASNARYFFNCGGQIKINCDQPVISKSTTATTNFKTLCDQTGFLYISAPAAGSTALLNNVSYTGFTQISPGSIASRVTYDTSGGYYGLTTTDRLLYKMTISTSANTYISVSARTNGSLTAYGDNGNIITITVTRNNATSEVVTATSTTTCTVIYPEKTNITDTWGTATIA